MAEKMGLKLSVDVYYDAAGFFEGPIESYQILFLDVKLQNGESGIELGKKLREKSSRAIIIYVSAYIEMAPMGYEVEAFRYLLKKILRKHWPIHWRMRSLSYISKIIIM